MNCHSSEMKMDDNVFAARFARDYRAMYEGASPTDFTALDFVGALGSVSGALLYARLFLPEFVEVDGMVFLKETVAEAGGPEGIRRLRSEAADSHDVEKRLNSFHINLNFPNRLKDNSEEDDRLLAEQLADMWGLRLQQLYPARRFEVRVVDEDGEASVCFHQEP